MGRDIKELEEIALWGRRKVLEMAVRADSGHVSTAMSQMEILVSLYFGGVLRYDAGDPEWEGRDRFILSKGQGGIGLYPILARAGFFPEADLDQFTREGNHLGVHAEWHVPGIEMVSGSLGHGLPVATGKAQALKGKPYLVFCLLGDGELHEGSNWEAMLSAKWFAQGNLVCVVDRNKQCTLGLTDGCLARDGVGLGSLRDKFAAFGFEVVEVDGHSLTTLTSQLGRARERYRGGAMTPLCVIAHTKKGKGLSVMEDKRFWHYRVPTGADLKRCWEDLGVSAPPADTKPKDDNPTPLIMGMRDRFFNVLFSYFRRNPDYVLISADNGAPTMDQFVDLPNQFYQVGIAEQQMVGMAAGLATEGKKPWCYAIAPFVTTRVHEFLKLDAGAMDLPLGMIGVGAGYGYAQMGPTHHTVEDIAIMRVLPNMQIYSPADGVTAEAVAHISAGLRAPHYIRLDRTGVPDLYPPDTDFSGGILSNHSRGPLCIIATGIMVHQAYQVAKMLDRDVRVLDIFRIKPLNVDLLVEWLAGIDALVTLEEHQLAGGLGSLIAETLADRQIFLPLLRLGVPDKFTFTMGGREVIWREYGLDVEGICKSVQSWKGLPVAADWEG